MTGRPSLLGKATKVTKGRGPGPYFDPLTGRANDSEWQE